MDGWGDYHVKVWIDLVSDLYRIMIGNGDKS